MIAGVVTGVRVSHDRATVDEINAAIELDQRELMESLLAVETVDEAFVLQTCNRAEAYVVTADAAMGESVLSTQFPGINSIRSSAIVWMDHEASLKHFLRVATGLESLVLGEDQILGQFREAYEDARALGGAGYVLEDALLKAIHVGERARTDTAINDGVISIGSAATKLVATHRPLEGATALVIGAGEMGTVSAHALADGGVARVIIANRTIPHALHIAERIDVDATAVPLSELSTVIAQADIVVSATRSEEPLLDATLLESGGETVIVDIAQPRDVDVTARAVDDVIVHDLDSLRTITDQTRDERSVAARTVEEMVDREFEHLLSQFKRKQADEAIATMYESAEHIKRRELQVALSKLDSQGIMTDEQRSIIESLTDSVIGQLLAAPTKSLRDAAANDDWSTIHAALQLFDPAFSHESSSGAKPEETGDDGVSVEAGNHDG